MTRVQNAELVTTFRGVDNLTPTLNKMRASLGQTSAALEGLKATTINLGRILLVSMGLNAVINSFSAVSRSASEFSGALANLSAITGATGNSLEFLRKKSFEVGNQFGKSGAEILKGFQIVGSVKADLLDNVEALSQVTAEVTKLSVAAGIDMPTAANAVGQALNQFGADASEASRFVDVLAESARLGASEVADTAQALKFVGTVAKQANISFAQTNAALQALAQGGVKAEQAGTGFRAVLLKLTTQSNADFNPSIVGLSTALQNLENHFASIEDPAERANAKLKMFDRTSITSANTLIQQRKFLDQVTVGLQRSGAAAEQAEKQLNSYQSLLTRLGNTAVNLGAAIGSSAEFKGVVNFSLRGLTAWLAEYQKSIERHNFILGTFDSLTLAPARMLGTGLSATVNGDIDNIRANAEQQAMLRQRRLTGTGISSFELYEFAGKEIFKAAQELTKAGTKLTSSGLVLESSIPSIAGLVDSSKGSSQLRQVLDSMGGSTSSELQRLVGGSSLNKPQFQSAEFDRIFRNVLEGAQSFNQGNFRSNSDRQASIDALFQQIDLAKQTLNVGQNMGFNTQAQQGALNELKNFIKGDVGERRETISLEIKAEDGLGVKVLKQKGSRKLINEYVAQVAQENAQVAN